MVICMLVEFLFSNLYLQIPTDVEGVDKGLEPLQWSKMMSKPMLQSVGRVESQCFTKGVGKVPHARVFGGGDVGVDADGVDKAPRAQCVEGGKLFRFGEGVVEVPLAKDG